MKCPLKFARYEFEGGTDCIGAECGFFGSVCDMDISVSVQKCPNVATNGIDGETNGIGADAPLVDALDLMHTKGFGEVLDALNIDRHEKKHCTRALRMLADMIERDYVRRDDYDFMADALKYMKAERDEWKAKYLGAVNDAEDYKTLWQRSRECSTKSAKRAAAVERLRNDIRARFSPDAIVCALLDGRRGKIDWSLECDAILDLLTDDGANDDSAPENDVSETDVDANDANADTREKLRIVMPRHNGEKYAKLMVKQFDQLINDELHDSREKLEADVLKFSQVYYANHLLVYDKVIELLDRQKAITERECLVQSVQGADAILTAENAELQAKVDELTAELDERKKAMVVLGKKYRDKATSRDHWAKVAGRHANTIEKLRRQLKAERELVRTWPRYSDGLPVRIGDAAIACGSRLGVRAIRFNGSGAFLSDGFSNYYVDADCPPEHQPPVANDGEAIEVGQMVYGGDGRAWVVEDLNFLDRKYPVVATCDGEEKALKPEWLTHDRDGGLA